MRKSIIKFLLDFAFKIVMDADITFSFFHEEYDDVPKHLRDVLLYKYTFRLYPKKHRKEINKWLDQDSREELSND